METVLANLLTILNNWLEQAGQNLPKLIAAVAIVLLALGLANLVRRLLVRTLRARQTDPELIALLARLVRGAIILLGLVLALEQAGTDVSALLTGLGILGFTLGFALQDISKNFVAGLLILITQPFDLNDTIEVAGFTGKVLDINLRDMVIEAADGRYVRIPNGDVITSSLVNYTRTQRRRISLRFTVASQTDLPQAREIALAALQDLPGLLNPPAPEVVFDTFGLLGIEGTAHYWINTRQTDYWSGQTAGLHALQSAFQTAGIEIPIAEPRTTPQ